jgi:hypothetical protein
LRRVGTRRRRHRDHLNCWSHHVGRRQRGAIGAWILVALIHLYVVLRLHTSAYRAPDQICDELDQLSQGLDIAVASDTGDDVAHTCKVLQYNHGSNNAVVTGAGLNPQLILNHEPGGSHALGKTAKCLQAQTEARAFLLSHMAGTWASTIAAHVAAHVIMQGLFPQCVRGAAVAQDSITAKWTILNASFAQGYLPISDIKIRIASCIHCHNFRIFFSERVHFSQLTD